MVQGLWSRTKALAPGSAVVSNSYRSYRAFIWVRFRGSSSEVLAQSECEDGVAYWPRLLREGLSIRADRRRMQVVVGEEPVVAVWLRHRR